MPDRLLEIYSTLLEHFGHQNWWPGDTPFEVMVGAVLTQNTNWGNVERAIANLRRDNLLSFTTLAALPSEILAEKIRPSGYFNLKAARLKNLLAAISDFGGLDLFFAQETAELRESLLAIKGIGPETADSIILYAANKPIFVVDAYTHRILSRHNLICEEADYQEIQELFMDSLPEDLALFNEYHALLVMVGKEYCKKSKPLCAICPLQEG
ncbi:MAG: endonuclease III domain-containing protein [Proteobacteria bacterium]|nr:endonuclease III domain-containing protein [Pseudomonadota bacterium]MBU1716908.1 endonuclease III domain-containing protein [Pseudomonadota bacterium]